MKKRIAGVAALVAAFGIPVGASTASPATGLSATHASAMSGPAPTAFPNCKRGYYKNVSGRCVHRPVHAANVPAGATAKCRDGTYSFSQHASGTCSHHGGVARWIHHP